MKKSTLTISLSEFPAVTIANLRQLGVETDLDHIFLRGERPPNRYLSVLIDAEHEEGRWASVDKTSRRQCVELDHDIVMLVEDLIEAANKLPATQ